MKLNYQNLLFKKIYYFVLLCLFLFSLLGYLNNFYQNRYDDNELSSQAISYQNLEKFDLKINNETCHILSNEIKIEELCVSNTDEKLKKIIVIGDSHSRLFLKPFNDMFGNDYSITYATGSSCVFFTNTTNTRCVRSDQEFVIDLLNKSENSIIIYLQTYKIK